MSSFTNRFHAVQARASELLGKLEMQRLSAENDTRSPNEDVRAAAFVASHHLAYAYERVLSALGSLRKKSNHPPAITPDDYERFLEYCFGLAGARGLSSDVVADALVGEAELAMSHAEDACNRAKSIDIDLGN
ncbi:MAG TPA: hypothetical protein PKZ32_00765 [Candidatus Melainabacteria bacterium]|nr:hypothetical protein [Candidatus Melainabacteria bacterium]